MTDRFCFELRSFSVHVGHQGCLLSPMLFVVFMDMRGGCRVWEPQGFVPAFAADGVLLAFSDHYLQRALGLSS